MPLHFNKAIIAFIAFCSLFNFKTHAQSNLHRPETWSVNAMVERLEYSGGYTMLSGNFSRVGPYSGSGILIDASTSQDDRSFPKVNGTVYASVPDGAGGWFLGGTFDLIDNTAVKHVAHIKADKTLDTNWKPQVQGVVYAMAISGNTLYIGGTFQSVNSQSRNFLAALDASNGNLTSWNPNANLVVRAIVIDGSTIYAGGDFTTVGGQTRSKLVALDASGVPTAWNPAVTGVKVNALAVNSSAVFVGGEFTSINGDARTCLGAVNKSDGTTLSWNPGLSFFSAPAVEVLLHHDGNVYVGGKFNEIGGETIGYLASVDDNTGAVNSWDPAVNSTVFSLALDGSTLYVGGQFSSVGGEFRLSAAAVDLSTAAVQPFAPEVYGVVETILIDNDIVFAGGDLNGVNWLDADNDFVLFNNATNEPWPFPITLSASGHINTIAVKDNVLYFGGEFTTVNGQSRSNLAAINLTDGQLLPWNPNVTDPASVTNISEVYAIKIKDNTLYIAGRFMQVAGQTRESLAAVDLTTAVATSWHPVIGNGTVAEDVFSFDILGNNIYVAGDFALAGGQSRTNLAAFDISGNLLSWDPQANDDVWKIRVASTTAYVVGNFDDIGGTTLDYNIAAIDLTTGNVNNWFPDFQGGYIMDVALTATDVIVVGFYSAVGAEAQSGVASFSLATGALNAWKPNVGQIEGGPAIYAVEVSPTRIHVGGDFNNVGDEARGNYAEYNLSACAVSPSISLNESTLISTPAESYQWYLNDEAIAGATGQTLDILLFEYGVYAVEATIAGCTGRSNDFVYLITGDDENQPSIKVFPNPVVTDLFIELSADATATMFDVTGKEVHRSFAESGARNRIDAKQFAPGMYLLKVQTKSHTSVHKVYKKF